MFARRVSAGTYMHRKVVSTVKTGVKNTFQQRQKHLSLHMQFFIVGHNKERDSTGIGTDKDIL